MIGWGFDCIDVVKSYKLKCTKILRLLENSLKKLLGLTDNFNGSC
jgi:hypothetical protein